MDILPRFIRHKDASRYLGVDRSKFDAEIRPFLTAIRLGVRSLAFDRLELDAWADEFKRKHGKPGRMMLTAPSPSLRDPLVLLSTTRKSRGSPAPHSATAASMPTKKPRKTMGAEADRLEALHAQMAEIRSRAKSKR